MGARARRGRRTGGLVWREGEGFALALALDGSVEEGVAGPRSLDPVEQDEFEFKDADAGAIASASAGTGASACSGGKFSFCCAGRDGVEGQWGGSSVSLSRLCSIAALRSASICVQVASAVFRFLLLRRGTPTPEAAGESSSCDTSVDLDRRRPVCPASMTLRARLSGLLSCSSPRRRRGGSHARRFPPTDTGEPTRRSSPTNACVPSGDEAGSSDGAGEACQYTRDCDCEAEQLGVLKLRESNSSDILRA